MAKTIHIFMFVIILMITVAGCAQTVSLPRETTETGGSFEEWTEKIQDDTEALLYAGNCKKLMESTAQSCRQYEGFTVNNIMEITDFTADEPYSFQDTIWGGCDSASAVGKTHEPKATTISYGTDGSSSYQVVCSSVCVWWQCTEEKESDQPPVQKIVTKDKQERSEPSLQSISGAPSCPSGTGGFTLGSPIPNRVVGQYLPPRLIGPWGNEANLDCWYIRDSGQKESDGSIIYEEVMLSAQYQTSGTFEARPTWAKELYCVGGTNRQHGWINSPLEKESYDIQLDETHYDLYSGSHVSRIIYPVVTFQNRYISSSMKTMADTLAREIETAPYAIRCPST